VHEPCIAVAVRRKVSLVHVFVLHAHTVARVLDDVLAALIQTSEGLAAAEYFLIVLKLNVAAVRRLKSPVAADNEKGIGVMYVCGSPMFCVRVSRWPSLS